MGQDETYRALEREYKNARAKYNRAQKNSVKYHIENCNDHNKRVRAIVERRAAEERLCEALGNFNNYRNQLGMKPIIIHGVNG